MSRVHVSLVGGQPSPVYVYIKNSLEQFDKIVLVCSEQTEAAARTMRRVINASCDRPDDFVSLRRLDPLDVKQVRAAVDQMSDEFKDDEVTVNVSGGTKLWSMLFYERFIGYSNAQVVLVDQNNNVWDMASGQSHALPPLSLEDIMALEGIVINQKTELNEYTQEDLTCAKRISKMWRRNSQAFWDITRHINDNPERLTHKSGDCSITRNPDGEGYHAQFVSRYSKQVNPYRQEYKLSSPHVERLLLNSGWFELLVADLLSRWQAAREVWVNCMINRQGDANTLNEYDVIVSNGVKYLFVECKTSIQSATDVDKFNNSKTYSGLAAKRIFITFYKIKDQAKAKCDKANIPYFAYNDISRNELDFFKKLDEIMKSTSTK